MFEWMKKYSWASCFLCTLSSLLFLSFYISNYISGNIKLFCLFFFYYVFKDISFFFSFHMFKINIIQSDPIYWSVIPRLICNLIWDVSNTEMYWKNEAFVPKWIRLWINAIAGKTSLSCIKKAWMLKSHQISTQTQATFMRLIIYHHHMFICYRMLIFYFILFFYHLWILTPWWLNSKFVVNKSMELILCLPPNRGDPSDPCGSLVVTWRGEVGLPGP